MTLPTSKPPLHLSRSAQVALQELPEDADVRVFTAAQIEQQTCPQLKAGTAAKGRVDFGDQVGARRLLTGTLLRVRAVIGEAHVCTILTDPTDRHQTELLVLTRNTQPLSSFQVA